MKYIPATKDVQPYGCCVSVATPLTRSEGVEHGKSTDPPHPETQGRES